MFMLLHSNKRSGPIQFNKLNQRIRAPALGMLKNRSRAADSPPFKQNFQSFPIDTFQLRCQGMKLNSRDTKSPEKMKMKAYGRVSKTVTLIKHFSATMNVPIFSSLQLKDDHFLPNIKRFSDNPQDMKQEKNIVSITADQIIISCDALHVGVSSRSAFFLSKQRYVDLYLHSEPTTIPKIEGVLQSLGICQIGSVKYYVSDLHLGYSFKNLISEFGKFQECTTIFWMKQLITTISKLHSIGFIHNRLNLSNISHDCQGKLLVNFFAASNQPINEDDRQGHLYYFSPQMLASKKVHRSEKNDVWAIGCIALHFLSGKSIKSNRHHPYNQHALTQSSLKSSLLMQRLRERTKASWIEGASQFSNNAIDFISKCLKADEEERPTARQLLQHPFLQLLQQ